MALFRAGVEPPGGTERLIQDLERDREDSIWLSTHMLELFETYGPRFVAIRHQKIVDHSSRFSELLAKLEAAGVEMSSVTIELLTNDTTPRI